MHISQDIRLFTDEDATIQIKRSFEQNDATLSSTIVIGSQMMTDFQKEIFEELLATISELLSDEHFSFDEFRQQAESAFQQTNLQLQAFSEKTSSDQYWAISWTIECVIGREYLATMIGKAWIAIIREWKTQYIIANEQEWDSIDQFSDMIEGEVHSGDVLISTWFPISHYIDQSDLSLIYQIAQESGQSLSEELIQTVGIRLEQDTMNFVNIISLDSDFTHTTAVVTRRFEGPIQYVVTKLWWIQKAKSIALYGAIWLLAVTLLAWLINSFADSTTSSFVSTTTGSPVPITIESIQKEIADFQNMPAASDQKAIVYEWIIEKLDTLDNNDKWTNDVADLRKILETQYYQWFNILLVNNDSFFKDPIYRFTQQEKNVMWEPQQVFFSESLMIAGEEWWLIGAINETLRWTLVSAAIEQEFTTCSLNVFRNGLYCVDLNNDVYMISKSWVEPVNTAWTFPEDIVWLWIYGNRNLYTLTNSADLTSNWSHIQRYSAAWSQTEYGEGLQYQLSDATSAWSWITSMTIDGTFMVWDPQNWLTQRRRDGATTAFNSRTFELGWGTLFQQYGSNTKVLSFEESNFVYLFDEADQSFTVYRSTPFKTNTAHTTSYTLQYFFRIKFAIDGFAAKDVFVEEGEQATLHILTDDGVYKLRLWEYRNDYMRRVGQ